MKILFVTLSVFGAQKKGGGERYVTEAARALRDLGYAVEIVAIETYRDIYFQPGPDAPLAKINVIRFFDAVKNADVVHVHQLNTPGFDYAVVASILYRKPLVLTDHGGGALAVGRVFGSMRLHFVSAAGYVSDWSRRDIDPRSLVRTSTILYGGGDHLPHSEPLDVRYDFGFVGRLLPHKGVHVLIKALPSAASLVVAGQPRDPEYYSALRRLAVGKSVHFIEDASDTYISALLKSIGALVVPSVSQYGGRHYSRPELLGLVALEALASGVPVIGSDVGGLGELLQKSNQIIVADDDVKAWEMALANFVRCDSPRVDPGEFSWRTVAKRCIGLYDIACGAAVQSK